LNAHEVSSSSVSSSQSSEEELFELLGGEKGLEALVSLVLDKANADFPKMFDMWVVNKQIQVRCYTHFMRSLIDVEFEKLTSEMWEDTSDLQI
jgi:hypothetical protein